MRTTSFEESFNPKNFTTVDIPSTWKAMEGLYDSGKARAIGVSNFSSKKLSDLLAHARVPPAVNQVECHPVWQQTRLRALCREKGVHLSVSAKIPEMLTFYCFLIPLTFYGYFLILCFGRPIHH